MLWLGGAAWAFEVPAFQASQHVVRVPEGLAFPTHQVSLAVSQTRSPSYVVIYERVADGRIEPGHESEAEDALEAVWAAWSLDPAFDTQHSNLALLALDEREVRLRAGTVWDQELGFGPERVGRVIDEAFLPAAQAGDLDRGLAEMVLALDRSIQGAEVTQQRLRQGVVLAQFGAVNVPSGLLLGWGLLRGRRARQRFQERVAARRAELARAQERVDELGLSIELRDRVVALKIKGKSTTALLARVGTQLDEVRLGLQAMEPRLQELERPVLNPLAAAVWDERALAVDAPFSVQVADSGNTALFEPHARTITIDPQAHLASLASGWEEARLGWQRLLDAVDASLRTARDDLRADDLARLREELATAGLPLGWLDRHPLAHQPQQTWNELDALRLADPVAYLDALDQAIARDDELEELVATLIGGRDEARRLREQADQVDLSSCDTVPTGPGDDPASAEAESQRAWAELERALARPEDPDGAERAVEQALEAAQEWLSLRIALRDAFTRAGPVVDTFESRLSELGQQLEQGRKRVAEVLQKHEAPSVHQVLVELDEATRGVSSATALRDEARRLLAGRHHLAALQLVKESEAQLAQAAQDLSELGEAVAAAERVRAQATQMWGELQGLRERHRAALAGWGEAPEPWLQQGDTLLATLRSDWERPGAWQTRLVTLQSVVQSWQEAERQARRRHEEAERARRARAAAQRAAVSHRSRSGSRTSGTSYRSSSSSSSSRSSGRSSGRSFSSSGRSAGRKF
jgi:hypothetical protein